MNKKTTSGISLVALIVTIIVLIILTAAVIVTFMEGGIIEKAKEAVFKSDIRTYQEILAIKNAEKQIELATGNGEGGLLNAENLAEIQAIIPEFKDEYDGLIEIQNGQIVLGSRKEEPYSTWLLDLGIGEKEIIPIVHNGIIPEGGVYYKGVQPVEHEFIWNYLPVGNYNGATKYEAGEEFPELEQGDVYVYGDYEYRYNMEHFDYWENGPVDGMPIGNGWAVKVLDMSKSSYGELLTTINGENLVNMSYTFSGCTSLINAPAIPRTVTKMYYTFTGCTSLVNAPAIPNSVTNMNSTFSGCTSLVNALVIPNSVTNMCSTFSGCTSLVNAPVIPNSVTNMNSTFWNCTNLAGTIEINANLDMNYIDSYSYTLKNTQINWITGSISDELKETIAEESDIDLYQVIDGKDTSKTGVYYVLHDYQLEGDYNGYLALGEHTKFKTKYINGAFPETVSYGDVYVYGDYEYRYNMELDFLDSIWYEADVKLDGWGVGYLGNSTEPGEILTSINGKDVVSMAGAFKYSNITTAPKIPETIVDISYTFLSCKNLTGEIEININPTYYEEAFKETEKTITLTGTSTKLDEIAETAVDWDGNSIGNVTVGE